MSRTIATNRLSAGSRSSTGTRGVLSDTTNYQINNGTLFEDYQTGWSKQSADGTIEQNNTDFFKTGTGSLKLVSGDGTNCFADKTINEDFTDAGVISFWLYVPSLIGLSNIAVYIASETNYSKFFLKTIQGTALHEGWNFLQISRNEFSVSGGESWVNNMVRLRMRINASSSTPIVYFDSFYKGIYRRPKIIITFDDNWNSAFDEGYSYMSIKNLKGTIYVIRDKVDTVNYMTTANCATVYNAGWDLSTHGVVNLITLETQALQEDEITYNEIFLTSNGFTRANKHYSYPNGGYNDNARNALTSLGYKTARTIIDRNQSNVLDEENLLCRQGVFNTTALAAAKAFVDLAIAQGTSCILNFHKLVESASVSTEWDISDFQDLIDYIYKKEQGNQIDVITISEWYDGLINKRKNI